MYRTIILTNLLSMWVNLPKVVPAALVVPETRWWDRALRSSQRWRTGRGLAAFWWGLE